jgi:hypothetical protein
MRFALNDVIEDRATGKPARFARANGDVRGLDLPPTDGLAGPGWKLSAIQGGVSSPLAAIFAPPAREEPFAGPARRSVLTL